MKTPSAHCLARLRWLFTASVFATITPLAVWAQPLVVDGLSVGPATGTSTNTVTANYFSGAIGEHNDISSAFYGLVVGADNSTYADYSINVGSGNLLSSYMGGAFGFTNDLSGDFNYTFGLYHVVYGSGNLVSGANHLVDGVSEGSAIFGVSQTGTDIAECLVSGINNVLNGATNSAAIGRGLILTGATSRVVIGQYNLGNETNALFVIGNGTAATPQGQSNAFTVSNNGDVRVSGVIRVTSPAGDVPMFAP